MRRLAAAAAACALVCAVPAAAADVPDISGIWSRGPAAQSMFQPPASGPGPVRNLTPPPPGVGGGTATRWQGDHTNPVLQPWVAEAVKRNTELDRADTPWLSAQQRCAPHGVPYVLQLNDLVQFLQTPTETVILYAREMRARLIHMNAQHPREVKPSYYGHSIGHWDGDTLVVDTIGLNDKTATDRFGTPHTDRLHVIERYRVQPDGRTLRVDFTVEDPGAFTAPWNAWVTYRREAGPLLEQVCAENNRDPLTNTDHPIPMGRAEF
jgi:hypothetical protein